MEENITHELKEKLDEAVERSGHWSKYIAITTALIAVIAAISALLAGHYSAHSLIEKNNAILYQAQASDQWNFFQAKSIKENLKENLYQETKSEEALTEMKRYQKEKEEIMEKAEHLQEKVKEANEKSEHLYKKHDKFAIAVTIFQIAIALFALSALHRKKSLQYLRLLSLLAAFIGLYFLASGLSL